MVVGVQKTFAVVVLACGFIAGVIPLAGKAAAFCDSPDCVPNVTRNVLPGAPCVPSRVYAFGLDSDSRTFVCSTAGVWAQAGRLVGLRDVALPCYALNDSAQESDGLPLVCADMNAELRWAHRADIPG
jgi:hypothetical protein